MPGRLSDASSSVSFTPAAADGACFGWVTNTGAGAITVTAPAGTTFVGGAATFSLPAGKQARMTYVPGGHFWQVHIFPQP